MACGGRRQAGGAHRAFPEKRIFELAKGRGPGKFANPGADAALSQSGWLLHACRTKTAAR